MNLRKYLAEFIGTFALVFVGTGAIISNDAFGGVVTHLGVALCFGLIVTAMICSVGDVSGAHINPAVTLGFCLARKFALKDTSLYIVFQIAGALCASLLLRFLFPDHTTLGMTAPAGAVSHSFLLEIILTFILMFVIINVSEGSKEKGMLASLAIGGTVTLAALFGGPVSGASMNPARSIGPALVSGHLESLWIYLTAPVIGALLACPVACFIQGPNCCKD